MKLVLLALVVAATVALPQRSDDGQRRYRYIPPKYEDYEDPDAPLFAAPAPPAPMPSPTPSPTPDSGEVDASTSEEPIDEPITPEPAPFPSPDQSIGQGQGVGDGSQAQGPSQPWSGGDLVTDQGVGDGSQAQGPSQPWSGGNLGTDQGVGVGNQGQGPNQPWSGGNVRPGGSSVATPPLVPEPVPVPEPAPKPSYGNPWFRPGQHGGWGYNKQPCDRFGCAPGFGSHPQVAHPFGYWGHANSYSSAGSTSPAAVPYYAQWEDRFSRKYLPPRF